MLGGGGARKHPEARTRLRSIIIKHERSEPDVRFPLSRRDGGIPPPLQEEHPGTLKDIARTRPHSGLTRPGVTR